MACFQLASMPGFHKHGPTAVACAGQLSNQTCHRTCHRPESFYCQRLWQVIGPAIWKAPAGTISAFQDEIKSCTRSRTTSSAFACLVPILRGTRVTCCHTRMQCLFGLLPAAPSVDWSQQLQFHCEPSPLPFQDAGEACRIPMQRGPTASSQWAAQMI